VKNHIPSPNPALARILLSGEMASVMRQAGGVVRDTYRAVVAKRSGALAESARVSAPFIGGLTMDRLCVDVVAGEGLPRGGYGASHEFGTRRQVEGPALPGEESVFTGGHAAADDFAQVLAIVNSLQ
jgi:hypothetical protein